MDMRVQQQILSPGMEDGEEANLCAKMFGILGDGLQRGSAGIEQDLVELLFVAQGQIVELFGDGEYDVVVVDRQQFALPAFQPFPSGQILALWTMAVTAGVVDYPFLIAVAASFHVSTQLRGPARLNGCHQTALINRQWILCAVLGTKGAEDTGHLEGWPRHEAYSGCLFFGGRPRFGFGVSGCCGN